MIDLIDMFPGGSAYNLADRTAAHRIVLRDGGMSFSGLCSQSYLSNIRDSKPRLPLGLAFVLPALIDHVGNVVRGGPEKQVIRIAARRIVAMVEDAEAVRNGTMCKHPGYSMRPIMFLPVYLKGSLPILATGAFTKPSPASIGIRISNTGPKIPPCIPDAFTGAENAAQHRAGNPLDSRATFFTSRGNHYKPLYRPEGGPLVPWKTGRLPGDREMKAVQGSPVSQIENII